MAKVKRNEIPRPNEPGISENKFIKNLLNNPSELKPGQVWLLQRDSEDYLPIEVVLTDTQYAASIGIVRGAALSRVNNGGDVNDVVLNPKNYSDTFPNGRVCLRFTDSPLSKDKLEFFIDDLTGDDWLQVKQSLMQKQSFHNEPQLELVNQIIERLSLYRTEAVETYENWVYSLNQIKNLIILNFLEQINRGGSARSYYGYRANTLDESISLDKLWELVEKNKEKVVNLYEDKEFIVDFILINELPHLIFYSSEKRRISSIELKKGDKISKAADNEFSIEKDGKFITALNPMLIEEGDWVLTFDIQNEKKSINVRIK